MTYQLESFYYIHDATTYSRLRIVYLPGDGSYRGEEALVQQEVNEEDDPDADAEQTGDEHGDVVVVPEVVDHCEGAGNDEQ